MQGTWKIFLGVFPAQLPVQDELGDGVASSAAVARGPATAGGEFRCDRAVDDALVQADDEDEARKVEEELHRFEDVEGIGREAAVQVVDEDHDPGQAGCRRGR